MGLRGFLERLEMGRTCIQIMFLTHQGSRPTLSNLEQEIYSAASVFGGELKLLSVTTRLSNSRVTSTPYINNSSDTISFFHLFLQSIWATYSQTLHSPIQVLKCLFETSFSLPTTSHPLPHLFWCYTKFPSIEFLILRAPDSSFFTTHFIFSFPFHTQHRIYGPSIWALYHTPLKSYIPFSFYPNGLEKTPV